MLLNITQLTYYKETDTLIGEASSIPLPAGQWPTKLTIQGAKTTHEFFYDGREVHEGELIAVRYLSQTIETILTILND